jgi:hypothetical protein
MAIHISNSELNKEYIHKGTHRMILSFSGNSKSQGDEIKFLLRSKNTELVKFIEKGKEKDEIRFSKKFSTALQEFEQEVVVKQVFRPDEQVFSGFLISVRNQNGDTASEEFVILCK